MNPQLLDLELEERKLAVEERRAQLEAKRREGNGELLAAMFLFGSLAAVCGTFEIYWFVGLFICSAVVSLIMLLLKYLND